MLEPTVFFVGTADEVAHHADPLRDRLNLRLASPERLLTEAQPGDLAVFYSEHFDRFRQAVLDLKQRRVATLYMVDGILEWRNAWENEPDEVACPYTMRPALADKIACIGPAQARVLEGWGNAGKTEIVGIPRFDRLRQIPTTAGTDDTFRLLVMTAKTPAFTAAQRQRVIQSLRDVRDWIATHRQVEGRELQVTWRLTGQLDQVLGVSNSLDDLSGRELADLLPQVDAVITTPSTSMLEAMLLDRPVALLDYHQCPHYVQGGWDIASAAGIETAIRGMAVRDPRRLLFQRNQLQDALQLETPATDRLADLIKSMLRVASFQLQEEGPLRFAARLLPPPALEPAPFVHRELYGEAPEFTESDTAVLQVQLAHSRREVRHLQEQLRQLRGELQQAHDIFETINRHPIAGPIVRIRQRILEWMDRFGRRAETAAEDPETEVPQRDPQAAQAID